MCVKMYLMCGSHTAWLLLSVQEVIARGVEMEWTAPPPPLPFNEGHIARTNTYLQDFVAEHTSVLLLENVVFVMVSVVKDLPVLVTNTAPPLTWYERVLHVAAWDMCRQCMHARTTISVPWQDCPWMCTMWELYLSTTLSTHRHHSPAWVKMHTDAINVTEKRMSVAVCSSDWFNHKPPCVHIKTDVWCTHRLAVHKAAQWDIQNGFVWIDSPTERLIALHIEAVEKYKSTWLR